MGRQGHTSLAAKKNQSINQSNIVTNSMKTLKMVHVKKKKIFIKRSVQLGVHRPWQLLCSKLWICPPTKHIFTDTLQGFSIPWVIVWEHLQVSRAPCCREAGWGPLLWDPGSIPAHSVGAAQSAFQNHPPESPHSPEGSSCPPPRGGQSSA